MRNSKTASRATPARQASAYRLSPIAAGCAALVIGLSSSAYAQQATTQQTPPQQTAATPDAPVQTVQVSGIRKGIEDAISSKKNSDMIVETISAEDLGKLPDDSIADALSSLPGVAAQIIGGRSATLNVRGLSGDFVNTLFNGREQASVGDNRAVMFDQYPAELISAASVYKTPDAELIGQGLAATIDLKTLLPLSFSKQTMQFKAMGQDESYGKLNPEVNQHGDRLSASYIDQFANRTIGVALGYAHLDSPIEDKQIHSWGIGNGPTQAPGYPTASSIQGAEWWSDSSASVRDGLIGVLEWKPNRDFHSVIDTYYSRSSENDVNRGLQTATYYGAVTNGYVNNSNFLSGGNNLGLGGPGAYGSAPVVRNDFNTENDRIFSIGWKNTYKADKWTFVGDISGSTASSQQSILETYSGAFTPVTSSFTANPFTGMALNNTSFNFANPSAVRLGDPGGWGQDGYDKFPKVTDSVREYRFNATRDLDSSVFNSVTFGGNITNRDKTRNAPEYFVDFAGMPYAKGNTFNIPSNMIVGPISLPNAPTITGLNTLGLVSSGMYSFVPNINGDIYAKDWEVDEKIATLYGQLNIDTELASIPLRGNIGLQYVHSKQNSTAIESNSGANVLPINTSGNASYHNVLPSLNLVATLPQDRLIRLGMAEELQRPRFDDMTAGEEATLSNTTRLWTSNAGNPQLRPTLANAFDLSFEQYFGKKGYVALAPYYKYLRTYIYSEGELANFSAFPVSGGASPLSETGLATQSVNGTGGTEKGIELTVSIPFELLHPSLEGFGVDANASRGTSSIQTNEGGTTSQQSLPGFSSSVANMVWYYEKNGFAVRYRESYRSAYLGEVQAFGANLAYSNFLGVHTASLQTSYEFNQGPLKGLTALFEVLNLNDPVIKQTFGPISGLSQSDQYGRTFLLGVNYKM